MRKYLFITLGMLVPVAASAALLATVNDRSAAGGEYYVNTGLSTQFGRMATDGDYLPGGFDESTPSFGTPSTGGSMIFTRRRLIK